MSKGNITNFTDMLKNEFSDHNFLKEDINKSFNPLLNTFYISFELRFPIKHVTIKLKNS